MSGTVLNHLWPLEHSVETENKNRYLESVFKVKRGRKKALLEKLYGESAENIMKKTFFVSLN